MIIDCIADLHGYYPELEGGDLLIVAGDCTARDEYSQWDDFFLWFRQRRYKKKILIGGNHDKVLLKMHKDYEEEGYPEIVCDFMHFHDSSYLCDSGTEFEGLKIWGSPWTLTFPEMNPHCKAFTVDTEEELSEKWALIPDDVDILITHGPPYGILDMVDDDQNCGNYHVGSKSLAYRVNKIDDDGDGKKRLLVFGHIHEGYGAVSVSNVFHDKCTWKMVNCSHVNQHYEPVNKPIRIVL
jgi:Icc-related predicted phosphoesterase